MYVRRLPPAPERPLSRLLLKLLHANRGVCILIPFITDAVAYHTHYSAAFFIYYILEISPYPFTVFSFLLTVTQYFNEWMYLLMSLAVLKPLFCI